MQRSALGSGGPIVSALALGTMTFGAETDERVAHQQLDTFIEHGGSFIDTADVYGNGESERIIGRWLRERHVADDLIVSTKGRFGSDAGSYGASRRSLFRAVDASLQRLQIDAIDLYLVHGWDRYTPVEQTLDALGSLVESGKIHAVGWSNVTGWQLQQIVTTARLGGYPVPVVVQPQYNLLDRGIELEVLPCCIEAGISVTPWSPLGGGWLTGKYRHNKRPEPHSRLGDDPERGVEAYELRNAERTWRILDVLHTVADSLGRPPAHVALAWLLSRPAVTSVLLGARTLAQLEDNLAAATLILDEASTATLSQVSAPGLPPYPYGFVQDWCDIDIWQTLTTNAHRHAHRP